MSQGGRSYTEGGATEGGAESNGRDYMEGGVTGKGKESRGGAEPWGRGCMGGDNIWEGGATVSGRGGVTKGGAKSGETEGGVRGGVDGKGAELRPGSR